MVSLSMPPLAYFMSMLIKNSFFQFAPTFIPGTGIVAGEILESLWSTLNSISPMARTATLANRAETLDDHASDSNHKKTIGMVDGLCRSYRRAMDMLEHAKAYYQNLTEQAGMAAVGKWTDDIESADGVSGLWPSPPAISRDSSADLST
jgi:hypothetical protein